MSKRGALKLTFRAGRIGNPAARQIVAQNDDGEWEPELDDDARLVAQTGAGSVEAFRCIVERHSPALYRVSFRTLGDRFEAEDVVQECLARLWVQAPNWKPVGSGLVAWLHRVAMNLCLDRLRRTSPLLTDELPEIEDDAPLPDKCIEGKEARVMVEAALGTLLAHHRAALTLTYFEGYSNAVAAEIMNMNIKAFESLLVRARRQLRRLLVEFDFGLPDIEMLR